MNTRFSARAGQFLLAAMLFLMVLVTACSSNGKSLVLPASAKSTPRPNGLIFSTMPPTWTATATESLIRPTSTPWPMSTINTRLTIIAGTTEAPGYGCKKHPDAWKVFTYKIFATELCEVRGGWTSTYQYKMAYPEGWVPNTFGDFYPNLAFSVGQPNVEFRIYQFFSYDVRSYSGSLDEAPEKAVQCDDNENCRAVVNQKEKFIASETRKYGEREVLIWDSEFGNLLIRRYFMIVPFHVGIRPEDRLFVIEFSALKSELESDWYTKMIVQIDQMIPTLNQR